MLLGAAFACSSTSSCGGTSAPAPRAAYSTDQLNRLAQHPPTEVRTGAAPASTVAPPRARADAPAELVHRDVPATVIAGREVHFGIDVVDEEMDRLHVALATRPDGAELDERTLTVRWQVPPTMTGRQTFTVRTDESLPDGTTAIRTHDIQIDVAAQPPTAGTPSVVPPLVGQLVTITSADYLARAARDWPILRVLEAVRDAAIDALPAAEQSTVARTPGDQLFRALLTGYADLHHNPRLDPAHAQFDHRFDAARWRLVAVRPRMNKAIQELRLAYQAVDVPEPVFAMFRVRLFRGATPPSPDVARANNEAFTRLVHQAFWNRANFRPGIREGRAPEVSAAVAALVRSVMTFRDAHNPPLRMGLAALPQEARMGGGSEFDATGHYVAGNAWAFSVANVVVTPPGAAATATAGSTTPTSPRAVTIRNIPVSSFTFDIGPNPAGTAFASVCPPRYREGGAGNQPGLAALCAPDGTVRIAERDAHDQWVATRRDSMHEHRSVVMGEMVERVSLRDPRRRNFEENGMTCVHCHMRNFDDGVLTETQVSDPRVPQPITPPRVIERVRMQILPLGSLPRSPWLEQQETGALCDVARDIRAVLNVAVDLPCPPGY